MQVTHSTQYRQTTTTPADLLGEEAIKQQQPSHSRGVHLCMLEAVHWRLKVFVKEREKARVGVKVELSSKQSQIPPAPPRCQVNWIIRSQGRYRHHLPRIAHKTTSEWLHWGRRSSLGTVSFNIQDSEWRSTGCQLTRPLSVKEQQHQESTNPLLPLTYCSFQLLRYAASNWTKSSPQMKVSCV